MEEREQREGKFETSNQSLAHRPAACPTRAFLFRERARSESEARRSLANLGQVNKRPKEGEREGEEKEKESEQEEKGHQSRENLHKEGRNE